MALPTSYLTSTRNLDAILSAIQTAQAPPKFTQGFLGQYGAQGIAYEIRNEIYNKLQKHLHPALNVDFHKLPPNLLDRVATQLAHALHRIEQVIAERQIEKAAAAD